MTLILVALILAGYGYEWTGFGRYLAPDGSPQPAKTLWDWMGLLLVPLVLAIGGSIINLSLRRTEREIADQQTQEAALEKYLDKMAELLLEQELREAVPGSQVRDVARARTLSLLRRLDGRRKATVLQFLYEANLIRKDKAVVELQGADLNQTILLGLDLRRAELAEIDLSEASLSWVHLLEAPPLRVPSLHVDHKWWLANLSQANLSRSYAYRADLHESYLHGANLMDADLRGADLQHADLSQADLTNARLQGADLRGANLGGAVLAGAELSDERRGLDRALSLPVSLLWRLAGLRVEQAPSNLEGADLSGADLTGARVSERQLARAKSLKAAVLPSSVQPEERAP